MTLLYSFYIDTLTDSAYIIYGEFEKTKNKYINTYNLTYLESIWNLVDDKIEKITNMELYDNIKIDSNKIKNIYSTFEKAYHSLIFTIFSVQNIMN